MKETDLADAAQLSSLSDETPEGRSIVVLAKEKYNLRGRELSAYAANFIPFSAVTRMSGVDLDGREIRKGAFDAIVQYCSVNGNRVSPDVEEAVKTISNSGGTPLLVAEDHKILGTIHLKDIIKGGMRERFDQLRAMGIRTVMITGDNPLTAAAIAREAGLDDFLAQAKPEDKLALIRKEQAKGKLVAMTGDGTNDAPALAQADVGLAMNAGTQAAKEAGNMVDLDSNPTKLIEVVEIGKQLLITRGALTTFSVANDVAKYFAIIPAMFAGAFPVLNVLNIMGLKTPESAILSAVIFNALIIIALVPLALRGVRYRPLGASALLALEPARLRRRRHHRAVHRHQGDRLDHHAHRVGLAEENVGANVEKSKPDESTYSKGRSVTPLSLFGLLAVTVMVVCYALEKRHSVFILAFAVSCVLASVYGFLQGAWPFGLGRSGLVGNRRAPLVAGNAFASRGKRVAVEWLSGGRSFSSGVAAAGKSGL